MMKHAVLIDFGSTFTKLAIADNLQRRIILTAMFPSTVRTDARIGLRQCLDAAEEAIGSEALQHAVKLSSSSAAGGLRMAVIGLTPTLSITAGRNAAFGAGAKILGSFSGTLDSAQVAELETLDAEIILLCGGYENGNVSMVLHNAEMLARSAINVPIIYAGNSAVGSLVRQILTSQTPKECFVVPNIIPNVGQLNIAPTEEIIRNVFMKRIVNMKGLDKITQYIDEILMPTPAAVLSAGELLSRGTEQQEGLGALMIVDIGGATTDIHTYIDHQPYAGARLLGAVEPYAKRTVEGDLGMRESSVCLMQEAGAEQMAFHTGLSVERLAASIAARVSAPEWVAEEPQEIAVDQEIASQAARISARRHAGRIRYVYSSNCTAIQVGKNLTELKAVIGTGGPIINSTCPSDILKQVFAVPEQEQDILLPRSAELYLDQDYIFYAAGLLREYDADLALAIMKNSLRRL